ncbi:VCBS domain-containing protein [Devosia ginsengisoli]|uniref:VCBS domain-containing protein n=1 Tax=Devosia ginsengisoli TaxID=400770 RepID=UPI0026F2A463|nr:VCBS domain-containing protein [Devosia ginsengisoli]MCR6673591.1 VCBS domain-containing protein [Devosia ginsengisoli]
MAYAEYLENGGRPLTDVIVKAAADRSQSLHDNLLGNFGLPTLADRFPGDHYDPTGATSTGIYLEIFNAGYAFLHDRPYFGGYTGNDAGPSRAFDLAHDLIPASFGKLVATDVDGDELVWSVQGTGEGQYGTLHVDADGTWRYDLDNARAETQALYEGQQVSEVFIVQVDDGNGGVITTTITINVTGTNDAPEFDADFVWPTTLTENEHGTQLAGNIAALIEQVVSDPDGGDAVSLELTFTYPSGSGLASWTATVDEAGNAIYSVPASHADFNGDVSVLIKATDSYGAVTTKTITVTVTPVNDAPTISGDTAGLVWEPGDLDAAIGANHPALFTTLVDINDQIGELFAANANPDAVTGGFDWDMDAILAGTKALLGLDASDADAIAYVWSHIDRNYLSAVNGTPATSEASFRLGLEYIEYLQGGGKPLYDVIAKSTATREQTLHDNIMSGVTGYALIQRWVNQHPNPDLYAEFLGILTNDPDLAPLVGRDPYQGNAGETNTVLAFDIQHGFLPAASGQLTVSDPDAGDSHEWSATGSTPYGIFAIDQFTGEWTFTFDPAAANGLNEGDVIPVDFTVTVTDSQGATDTQVVTITIKGSNDAPTVDQAISVAPTAEDAPFSFTIPSDAFDDVDTGAALTYTATLADGSPLPAWLEFDGETFSGTPTNDGVGTISIKVTATDDKGAFTSQTFNLTVTNTNDAPTFDFHQGFETDRDGIFDASSAGWAGYGSVEVVTDFNGVSAADGSSFAILKEPTPVDDNVGPFSRFGGYRDLFVDGMTAETKVYLDTGWAEGEGFSYSVAMNGSTGNHLQDYVFNVVMTDTGLKVGTGTGVDHDGPVSVPGNAGPIGAGGWYTLQHVFNNVNGELVVTFNVLDAGGVPVFTFDYETGHDIADVGGNRYAWYARIAVEDGIAVDDISLTGVDSGEATEDNAGNGSTVSLTGQVLFDDVDGDAIPTVDVATVPGSYIGTFTATVTEDPSGASGGTITWTFDANVDGLTTGQTIIQTYDLMIDDGYGGTAVKTITVTITGTNDAPTVGSTIADQTVAEDATFSFAIPTDAFEDVDDATLTYTATLADGSPLPSWLDFDDATGTFSGTPTDDQVGTISVKVTATDSFGEAVSQIFDLTVSNTPDVLDTSDLAGEVTEPVALLSLTQDTGQVLVDTGSVIFSGSTTNQYGSFIVNPISGKWTFTLGLGAAVQALNDGDQVDTIFTVTIHDLATGLDTTADVVITIHGTNEQINGSSGDDVGLLALMGSDYGDTINANAGDDMVYAGGGNDIVYGGNGDDTIYAGSGNDTVHGGNGDDTIDGGSGDDILNGDAGDDHILGGSGNDTIDGGTGDDYLLGGSGDDFIYGNGGSDQLVGGAGDDILWGGAGRDTLTGGDGADVFRFWNAEDSVRGGARDVITDFEKGVDKIDLSQYDANIEIDGPNQFFFRGSGTASRKEDAGFLKFYHENGKTFIVGGTDSNPDGLGELLIELDGVYDLTADDFIGISTFDPNVGTSGDDTFYAGIFQNTFTGNGGTDTFVFTDTSQSKYGNNWDIITDWQPEYLIDLSGMGINFTFDGAGAANRDVSVGGLKYFHKDGNTFVVGDTTNDGLADFRIQLDGDHNLTTDNFILI